MKKHLKSIDALRGIAATWVVFYHLWNRYYPALSTHSQAFRFPDVLSWDFITTFFLFQYGYIGVTLFFVLSGFCIHLPQAKRYRETGKDQLCVKTFGKKRFFRLYPAYFSSIILTSIALGFYPILLGILKQTPVDFLSVMDLSGAFHNMFFLQQLFPKALLFNGVYWTLLFEVQFYAFYPALLWLIRRTNLTTVFWILLGTEIASLYFEPFVPHLFLTRYYEWFLGVLAAEWYVSDRCPIPTIKIALVGIIGGIAATLVPFLWPYRDVLNATGFFGLLMYFIYIESNVKKREISRSFGFLNLFVPIGVFSYSLYLIHIPIIDLTWTGFKLGVKYGWISLNLSKALSLISVPLSFLCAYWFYHIFEKPYLQVKSKEILRGCGRI